MTSRTVTANAYETALEAGRAAAESEFRASAVAYLPNLDAIEIITIRNGGFIIPRHVVTDLRDVVPTDLADISLWPDGSIIEINSLDIHLSVDAMVKAALTVLVPNRIIAGMFAAAGGAAKSTAKADSSRQNGKKGGRPKKTLVA